MHIELTKRLQSAAKGKAPIVAIPIEGHAPVCLVRKRLSAWLKGVEVHSVEVVTPDVEKVTHRYPGEYPESPTREYEGPVQRIVTVSPGTHRWLKIAGRVPSAAKDGLSIRTSCKMVVISRPMAALEIWKWAEAERAKNKKIIGQGAISAVALKEAKKAAKAKERAAKLLQMEKGGSDELDEAKNEVINILAAARRHGRGVQIEIPDWKQRDIEDAKAETILRHVSHHKTSHRVRKTAAVCMWRMRALRGAWYDVTKFNPGRRKTTANKFLKVKKAIRVIQIVKDYNELAAKLKSIVPEPIPNPRWPDEDHRVFWINPLDRPKQKKQSDWEYYNDRYDREGMAKRLRIARETIRVLTPPPDEMEVAA